MNLANIDLINIRTSLKTTNTVRIIESTLQILLTKAAFINDCPIKLYVGQTGRNFLRRFKEHIQSIKANKPSYKFAQDVLNA
jgi:hypothetical protein